MRQYNNELNECDLKRLQALSESSMATFTIGLDKQPVFPQDIYSVGEAARLLGISEPRVRYFSHLKVNPLPIRRFPNGARGSFILRDEFLSWVKYYSIKAGEELKDDVD